MIRRPAVLFYCQHSLGLGHLVRSWAVASALAERFGVAFLSGGELPDGMQRPEGVTMIPLPPVGLDGDGTLVSLEPGCPIEHALVARRHMILRAFRSIHPAVIVVELFPFGRKKFARELVPMLDEAHKPGASGPLVLSSVRDILVSRADQNEHDERARLIAERYFDAVLVHADPALGRFEDSFHPYAPLRVPVHYTGFVCADRRGLQAGDEERIMGPRPILVSAGGGRVGEPLVRAAIDAQPALWTRHGVPMRVIAGPFFPEDSWRRIEAETVRRPGLELVRSVPSLPVELAGAAVSVSQGGYNTTLEVLRSGVPALLIPFGEGEEDEQRRRSERLAGLGAVRVLEADRLSGDTLAVEIGRTLTFQPRPVELDLDGARHTARLVDELLHARLSEGPRHLQVAG